MTKPDSGLRNSPENIAYNVLRQDGAITNKNYYMKSSRARRDVNWMRYLSIGVNEYTNDSLDYLIGKLDDLNEKKLNIKSNLSKAPGLSTITCKLIENKIMSTFTDHNFLALKQYVSFILADYIIKFYEEKLITRIINMNYCYFNQIEKNQIYDISLSFLRSNTDELKYNLYSAKRRNLIFKKLIEYFENNNEIIIDGFVNFRVKDYIKELEDIVDKAVDAFLMEREYQEFIKLLRYFVDIQEPRMEAVHILPGYDNKYIILDQLHNDITDECIKEFLSDVPESDINFDDLLVSSLITIAPIRIYIHHINQIRNKELLETIKNVFINKVIFCSGCDLCKQVNVNIESFHH